MILKLRKGAIEILDMRVPEPVKRTYIQYDYEYGTNHLKPSLHIGDKIHTGDRMFVDLGVHYPANALDITVKLWDSDGVVIQIYKTTIPYHVYSLVGKKPMRADLERYIAHLEAEVRRLTEEGEVI